MVAPFRFGNENGEVAAAEGVDLRRLGAERLAFLMLRRGGFGKSSVKRCCWIREKEVMVDFLRSTRCK